MKITRQIGIASLVAVLVAMLALPAWAVNPWIMGRPAQFGSTASFTGAITATGGVVGAVTGAVTATTVTASTSVTVTSASAAALTVGLAGATNPAFTVDSSTASQAAGLKVTGATAAGTVAVAVTSSGAAANLTVNAKGAGTIGIGSVSTGPVTVTSAVIRPAAAATLTAAAPALTKAVIQATGFWGVDTTTNAVGVLFGSTALDAADIGSEKWFVVTTGHATQALTVAAGAGVTTITTINTLGTTCEDVGDAIQCIPRTTTAATCITYCGD